MGVIHNTQERLERHLISQSTTGQCALVLIDALQVPRDSALNGVTVLPRDWSQPNAETVGMFCKLTWCLQIVEVLQIFKSSGHSCQYRDVTGDSVVQ